MKEDIQEHLNRITNKRISDMTDNDKDYLRARVSYLNDTQLQTYKSVIEISTYKELQQEASKLGMGKTVGKTKEELEEFIKNN